MKLSWLLESVAGKPEALNREAYAEIAHDHLHDVVQLAAEWETEKSAEFAEAREEVEDERRKRLELKNQYDAMRDERDEHAAELAAARGRIQLLETKLASTEARAS